MKNEISNLRRCAPLDQTRTRTKSLALSSEQGSIEHVLERAMSHFANALERVANTCAGGKTETDKKRRHSF